MTQSTTKEDQLILVDEHDKEVGAEGKLSAHQKGLLHRAISVFIFNKRGELMLQKRAKTKYHSAGMWSNTCCSHPRPGEDTETAARRRLQEEMGFTCDVRHVHHLLYRTTFPNGLIENEYDHMFVGEYEADPVLNSEEAEDWRWMSPEAIKEDIAKHPEAYSYWFRLALDDVLQKHAGFLKAIS
ncbi:MAG: isopentenyl-diphosphate delta-isomerase [Candidatus Taylorbacteria bacterium CG11_big_fil_rev_8_21_14_0_20_46_11]|uniref:Isopentenyl-diphosphate delta-isomerase n=1 Tax=Candidatus Taylorbacteria bacterium CG11_big_fil_rev_8_21_14_0_20_46_11 TaxID=1975025 RepID=A0A2H0KC85_9BACT|nr:MAG: isopentenyl-diphosphate delta-isomerase [Candidatus Taylorbacteria bacterium CG11_big_fil_rev_8_21_14_0_20_46_11]